MNILVIGGAGTFLNNLLIKCRKEGHKVSVLTGSRFSKKEDYQKCFEVYKFPYDAGCINEIYESVAPDVTIYMGAYDTNYTWKNEEDDSVKYIASMANIIMGYIMSGKGRFIYLSSESVFSESFAEAITEGTPTSPNGFRAQAIYQGENLCENYRRNRDMDIVTVRFDHLYGIPENRSDVNDIVNMMCLESLSEKIIHYTKDSVISPLYEKDGVEAIHRLIVANSHEHDLYQISSGVAYEEEEIANIVRNYMNPEIDVVSVPGRSGAQSILSGELFESEFGKMTYNDLSDRIKKIVLQMKKNEYIFLSDEEAAVPLSKRLKKNLGWFVRAIVPFIESVIVFIPVFLLYNQTLTSNYFAKLDIYLLYVLLFAVVFGQQQATFSALLAVIGFFIRQTNDRTGFEILLDGNTYVWVAQLFIVGLSVGYMRDQIRKLVTESQEEKEYLEQQIDDIQDINSTNVRVKDILENQVVNQADSIGKVYSITSALDQYSPEEVLFYAAETVSRLMKTDDVAIYTVSNSDYARLFSSTSAKSRSLGNSLKYSEMGEMYETISSNNVYINRKMDSRYPLMATAIFENNQMQMIIMVWGLSWENMTLGQANTLVIVSALIQNAVLRSSRYLAALEDRRYVDGTQMLESESFKALLDAFSMAETKGLTECTILKIANGEVAFDEAVQIIQKGLRQTDYFGKLGDGFIYALLSNTNREAAGYVINRFADKGLTCEITEEYGL